MTSTNLSRTQESNPNFPLQSHARIQPGQHVTCVECERLFSPMEVLNYGQWTVCYGCKDRFIQKLEQGGAIGGITAWRHKGLVRIAKDDPKLPHCCTKCGETATVEKEKKMRYLSPRSLLGIPALFFGIIPGLVLMLILGGSVTLKFGHCEKHARRQKICKWFAGGTMALGIIFIACLAAIPSFAPDWMPSAEHQWAWYLIAATLVAGLISAAMASPGVSVARGNKEHVDLKVQSRKFKNALPDWNNFLS